MHLALLKNNGLTYIHLSQHTIEIQARTTMISKRGEAIKYANTIVSLNTV